MNCLKGLYIPKSDEDNLPMSQSKDYQPVFSPRENWVSVTPRLDSYDQYHSPQLDSRKEEPKSNAEDFMMELIKVQRETIGSFEESQIQQKETITKQDDMIRQLMMEVAKLTEHFAMKSTNQTPNESEVRRMLVESDDSDDELILQDEPTKETAR